MQPTLRFQNRLSDYPIPSRIKAASSARSLQPATRGSPACRVDPLETPRDAECDRLHGRVSIALRQYPIVGQAIVHILVAAMLGGLVVRGPMVGQDQAFVSTEGWLGSPPPAIERAQALARLASRYLAGHAPASANDLAHWAGITLREARQGLESADEVPSQPGNRLPAPRLLGPFDPLLHGWKTRAFVLGIIGPLSLLTASSARSPWSEGESSEPGAYVTGTSRSCPRAHPGRGCQTADPRRRGRPAIPRPS